MAILNKVEKQGEKFLGKIPYNVIKTYVLLTNPAVLGVYAGAKILPVVSRGLASKKMLTIYKKTGILTAKTFGKVVGGTAKYTVLGLGATAYLSAKGVNKGYNYIKNKLFSKNKNINTPEVNARTMELTNDWAEQYMDYMDSAVNQAEQNIVIEGVEQEAAATNDDINKINNEVNKATEELKNIIENTIANEIEKELQDGVSNEEVASEKEEVSKEQTESTESTPAENKEETVENQAKETENVVNTPVDNVTFEENTENLEAEATEQTFNKTNLDITNFIKNTPEFNIIMDKVDEKINARYSQEELTALFKTNRKAYEDIILKNFSELKSDTDFSSTLNKLKEDINSEIAKHELDSSVEPEVSVDGDSSQGDVQGNPTNDKTIDSIEQTEVNSPKPDIVEAEIEGERTEDSLKNIVEESADLQNVNKVISPKGNADLADLPFLEEDFEQFELNLPELNKKLEGKNIDELTFKNSSTLGLEEGSGLTEVSNLTETPTVTEASNLTETPTVAETSTVTETPKKDNEKAILDVFPTGKDATTIYKIANNGDIYVSYNFNGKLSGERLVKESEYLAFKKTMSHLFAEQQKINELGAQEINKPKQLDENEIGNSL